MLRPILTFLATGAVAVAAPTAAQQVQVPIAEGVMQISPDGECPEGSVRRTQIVGQQVAQQGYGRTIHYCVRADRMPEGSGDQPPQLVERKAWPTMIPISSFGAGAHSNVEPVVLTAVEKQLLDAEVEQIRFANYRLSGCHDRAHAAYLLLSQQLQAKAVKMWVVAPSLLTRALQGRITYPADASVNWGYHVALGFMTNDGMMLFDPTLSPGRLLTEGEWLGSFEYPSFSLRMVSQPQVYLFFDEPRIVVDFMKEENVAYGNMGIWTGGSFEYTGLSRENNWIPNALARDAIGALVEDATVCEALRSYKGKPAELLNVLQNEGLPSSCSSEARLFKETRAAWIERLE